MANDVFANGREISCKKADGKSICAFPDVCMTPPENPATPPGVPVPYPNTGFASDTTEGSKSVKISGKEIMLKNKSYFKKSTGDEAGCAAKKGVITSSHRGKVYFIAWSEDVKIEGENAVRHLDMTTHNHASRIANEAAPMVYLDRKEFPKSCEKHVDSNNTACKGAKLKRVAVVDSKTNRAKRKPGGGIQWRPDGVNCDAAKDPEECKKARSCLLVKKKKDKSFCCLEDTTGHHLIEVHCFQATGERRAKPLPGLRKYNQEKAPTVCASEKRGDGTHGVMHAVQGKIEAYFNKRGEVLQTWRDPQAKARPNQSKWRYKHARDAGLLAHMLAFPHCNPDCIKDQLDAYHKNEVGLGENTPLRTDPGVEDLAVGDLTKSQKRRLAEHILKLPK